MGFVVIRTSDFLDAKQESAVLKNNIKPEENTPKLLRRTKSAQGPGSKTQKTPQDKIMLQVEEAEEQVRLINEQFLNPDFYAQNSGNG